MKTKKSNASAKKIAKVSDSVIQHSLASTVKVKRATARGINHFKEALRELAKR